MELTACRGRETDQQQDLPSQSGRGSMGGGECRELSEREEGHLCKSRVVREGCLEEAAET